MKRVLCLYRVSTKGQVDRNTDDIPMQRRECLAFIDRMEDWVFFDERVEKGVSGYKVSAENRDAILDIRALAEKKKFDVLLVFMFDRLAAGRMKRPFWSSGSSITASRSGARVRGSKRSKAGATSSSTTFDSGRPAARARKPPSASRLPTAR